MRKVSVTICTIFAIICLSLWGSQPQASPSPVHPRKTAPSQITAVNQETASSNIHPEFKPPPSLRKRVNYWKKVFAKYSSHQLLIIDKKYPYIIYTVLDFSDLSEGTSARHKRRIKRKRYTKYKKKYQKILRKLAQPKLNVAALSREERRVYNLFSSVKEKNKFAKAAKSRRFRSQIGQRDRFLQALITSGAYRPRMEQIFARYGLPKEITLLPFVESFFKVRARSRKGASGVWQFIRSTGRRFLRINSAIDERQDPFLATEAAAKFMKENYQRLGSWPLAITAYNHGPGGVDRGIRKTKSRDLAYIIEHYKSRRFGFDSQNFFAELLAVVEIVNNYQKFFGPVKLDPPLKFEVVEITTPITLSSLVKYTPLSKQDIIRLNPAFNKSVRSSWRPIPRRYKLNIPPGAEEKFRLAYAKIPPTKFAGTRGGLTRKGWHKVEWGETLSEIARYYGASISALTEMNDLYNKHWLRAGQLLRVPAITAVVADAETDWHRVRRGDTLSRIARRYGVSVNTLARLNSLPNRHLLQAGQLLRVSGAVQPKITPVVSSAPMMSPLSIAEVPARSKSSDYGVVLVDYDQGIAWAVVKTHETLGHFADWCRVRTQVLRDLNDLSYHEHLKVGQRIMVDISRVGQGKLAAKREAFHEEHQRKFLTKYNVERVETYVLKRHQSAWYVCRYYNVPLWLVEEYNKGRNLAQLSPGDRLRIPILSQAPLEL